jgi:Domain of unknown function (DUF4269)
MTIDFHDIKYLLAGSEIQKAGHRAITNTRVFELLSEYQPVLVGTLPLDLFIEKSDLDIICFANDLYAFTNKLTESFGNASQFEIEKTEINKVNAVIARFESEGFAFEIFGQPLPVQSQIAYRHLIIEHKILLEEGSQFKKEILHLKQNGLKTEPAFAKLLNLQGDPFEALLSYY